MLLGLKFPDPSWPTVFEPQQYTFLDNVTAHEAPSLEATKFEATSIEKGMSRTTAGVEGMP